MSVLTQLRSFRPIGDYAIFDFLMSFAVMYFVAKQLNWDIPSTMASVIPLSVFIHLLVKQDTRLVNELRSCKVTIGTILFYVSLVYYSKINVL